MLIDQAGFGPQDADKSRMIDNYGPLSCIINVRDITPHESKHGAMSTISMSAAYEPIQ